ncbi:unnamed protein product [Prorocentrum cordatum]|uniref:Solute carrier family 40 protein n=1 Tax=Prorocentrum cordatum TaxID=2364126 RepID=A0ABN9USG3_9DINO|nr:unnamed protein product [Polarella glacialis]
MGDSDGPSLSRSGDSAGCRERPSRITTTGLSDRFPGLAFIRPTPISFARNSECSSVSDDSEKDSLSYNRCFCSYSQNFCALTRKHERKWPRLHGLDVFTVFDVKKSVEFEPSSRLSRYRFLVVLTLSGMSAASFCIHGLLIWRENASLSGDGLSSFAAMYDDKPTFLNWFQNSAAVCIYITIGVVLPVLARYRGASLDQVLSVAYKYDERLAMSYWYMLCSFIVWPVMFGLVAPVLIWMPRLLGDHLHKSIDHWVPISVFIWTIGMLSFGPSRVEEAGISAVFAIVTGVARQVDDMSAENISWEKVLNLARATDYLLAEAFKWNCLGRLIIFRVAIFFLLATGFGLVGLFHHKPPLRHMYQSFGVMSAVCGSALLFRLGRISESCSGTTPASGGLKAVLLQKMMEHTNSNQRMLNLVVSYVSRPF